MTIRVKDELIPLNLLVIVLIGAVILSPFDVLRIVLGLPFLLFFPGYTLMAALFPRREGIDSIERVVLSFGMSIVVVPLIGLILNYTPWGIRLLPILICLTLFVLITSIVARYRRWRLTEAGRFTVSFNLSLALWKGQDFIDKVLSVILIGTILGATGTLGYVVTTPKGADGFTEFFVLGLEIEAIDYPRELRVGEEGRVRVVIINREHKTMNYWVAVRIDGVRDNEMGPLELEHDRKWEDVVNFTPVRKGDNQKVEFLLYKNGKSEPYRKLHLWVNVKE